MAQSADLHFDSTQHLLTDILSLHGKWMGDKPALIAGKQELGWAEFERHQNQAASGLLAMGLAPGDRVAIVADNSIAMVEAMFGALRAGLVLVPLNLSVSDAALESMMHDAGVRAVFASSAQLPRVEAFAARLPDIRADAKIALDGSAKEWAGYETWRDGQSDTNPGVKIAPDDLFNIIYSSGTTGQPKGIVHNHVRRLAFIRDLGAAIGAQAASRALVTIGLYSNISLVSALIHLTMGGTVVLQDGFSAEEALAAIEEHGITHLFMVPVQYQAMWDVSDFDRHDLSSLECLFSVGSALRQGLKGKMIDTVGLKVMEAYGLTEGPVTVIEGEDCARLPGSVGKPLIGTDIRIIDSEGCEVAPGTDGEIVGRGPHTTIGYYRNPQASAEASWVSPEGELWLRTGDLGRLDEDGFLSIVGRLKDMIVSGGQNIYPSDIEAELLEHSQVGDCAVIGIAHEKWGETPLAVVVPAGDGAPDPDALKDWLNERVGKRQRIYGVELVQELPRNSNGKVLKRVLRDRYDQAS